MSDTAKALHRLRSMLAAIQAEAELLELDRVDVARLKGAVTEALNRLADVEATVPAGMSSRPRVVLLEDDERVGAALVRRLARQGYDACLVFSVAMALSWAAGGLPLVADLTALEDATQAEIACVRKLRPIVLTGASYDEARKRATQFAPSVVLNKPLDVAGLSAILRGHRA